MASRKQKTSYKPQGTDRYSSYKPRRSLRGGKLTNEQKENIEHVLTFSKINNPNIFLILRIQPPTASEANVVKTAFKRFALLIHPDKIPASDIENSAKAAEAFKILINAYEKWEEKPYFNTEISEFLSQEEFAEKFRRKWRNFYEQRKEAEARAEKEREDRQAFEEKYSNLYNFNIRHDEIWHMLMQKYLPNEYRKSFNRIQYGNMLYEKYRDKHDILEKLNKHFPEIIIERNIKKEKIAAENKAKRQQAVKSSYKFSYKENIICEIIIDNEHIPCIISEIKGKNKLVIYEYVFKGHLLNNFNTFDAFKELFTKVSNEEQIHVFRMNYDRTASSNITEFRLSNKNAFEITFKTQNLLDFSASVDIGGIMDLGYKNINIKIPAIVNETSEERKSTRKRKSPKKRNSSKRG